MVVGLHFAGMKVLFTLLYLLHHLGLYTVNWDFISLCLRYMLIHFFVHWFISFALLGISKSGATQYLFFYGMKNDCSYRELPGN